VAKSGYDARQGARSTFAFQGAAPAQTRPGASGQSRGASVQGGNSTGQMIAAAPDSTGGGAGQLGEYFGELMRPYVEQKQKEQFFKGFAEAASGTGIEELTNSNSPITKVFGPTGFEQGAQFYTANTALDQFSSEILADIDNLKQMVPAEAAKVLAAKSDSLMTTDQGSNMLIQAGLMERMGPVMNTVAKARMAWQQDTAVNSMNLAHDSASTAFQQVMVAQGAMSDPTDADRSAVQAAAHTFMSGRAKPEGMTDESYQKYLGGSAMSDIVAGRFYAVTAMKTAGSWNLMDEETRTKLEIAHEKHSNRANAKAALKYVPDLIKLETAIKLETVPGGAMGAAAELARINGLIMAASGTDIPMFDYKDFKGTAGSVVDVMVAGARRVENRREQLADAATARGYVIADRQEDAREAAEAVLVGVADGDVPRAVANGAKPESFDAVFLTQVRKGDFGGIVQAYRVSSHVSRPAATQLQNAVTTSIGEEYNADVGKSHAQWKAIYAASPTAAAAYYGPLHAPMMTFDTLLGQGSPQNAFKRAFGNPGRYSPAAIPAERSKEATADLAKLIDTREGAWFGGYLGGGTKLNASGRAVSLQALKGYYGILAHNNPGQSSESIAAQAYARATADGVLERYGAYAWDNEKGTVPLARKIGLHGTDASAVISHVIERSLRLVGLKPDDATSYEINHVRLPDGGQGMHVIADPGDGGRSRQTTIPLGVFRGYQQYRLLVKQQGAYGLANRGLSNDPKSAAGKRDAAIAHYRKLHRED